MADDRFYWMDDDDFGDFGGGDDGGDGDDDDQDQDDQDQDDSDQDQDDGREDGGQASGAGGGDGGDDQNLDDYFASEEDLPQVDDDVFASASDFPNADESDFKDDPGDWTPADYQEAGQNLFGDHQFYGDTLTQQKTDEGFKPYDDDRFGHAFDQIAPGTSDSVHLFERDGSLFAFGLVSQAVLGMLMARYTGIDMSGLEVGVPPKGEPVPTQPLPPAFANVAEKDAVDLRKYCMPVGDQGQTGRCSAFAWTHSTEMSRNTLAEESPPLCPTFTMLEFQRMQGDAQDYEYPYKGGAGTIAGPHPGQIRGKNGTFTQALCPNHRP